MDLFWNWLQRKFAQTNSDRFICFLRKAGCVIGRGCVFYSPKSIFVDLTRPYLINIGDNVLITRDVTILSHGYEWAVITRLTGIPYGNCAKVTIGNNVFIGMGATILKGVTIGDNVIIGAGSVISKDIASNSVAVGNPGRVVCTMQEYQKKLEQRQHVEAIEQGKSILEFMGRTPTEEDYEKSYFSLFHPRTSQMTPVMRSQCCGDIEKYLASLPIYGGFDAFLKSFSRNDPDD